ncbi:hypothetical protein BV898_10232 [Hypsibius exemplaris]|uniref:Chitin-binding type-2 domain-containing protein n=1 Tax=Hypsibius exemplaris TaxID=2072580 RepID=A0A1W0WKB3_HYPEX|nr:hypothetical protein BV898_10232 [Hypsibius exemplaris]
MWVSVVCLIFLGIAGAAAQQKATANAGRGQAGANASSIQSKSGKGISIGGSASSQSKVDSNGSSDANGEATGGATTAVSTEVPVVETEAPTQAPTAGPTTVKPSGQNGSGGNGENGLLAPPQVPGVWDALDTLRGKQALTSEEINAILAIAQEGQDYPNLANIPADSSFQCGTRKGYYADIQSRCQVFHRCDINGVETNYLCPNKTVFNQIDLVCDWFFNVNCPNSVQFYDYSNSRLYNSNWVLLDTPPEKIIADAASAVKNIGSVKVQTKSFSGSGR